MIRNAGGLLLILLTACSPSEGAEQPPENALTVDCALGGAEAFDEDCAVERVELDGTVFYTLRHPDGSFRRFEVLRDGRGLATADGADEARITVATDMISVAVGEDRYLMPATIKDDAANH